MARSCSNSFAPKPTITTTRQQQRQQRQQQQQQHRQQQQQQQRQEQQRQEQQHHDNNSFGSVGNRKLGDRNHPLQARSCLRRGEESKQLKQFSFFG